MARRRRYPVCYDFDPNKVVPITNEVLADSIEGKFPELKVPYAHLIALNSGYDVPPFWVKAGTYCICCNPDGEVEIVLQDFAENYGASPIDYKDI